jgi:hypothetical protein
MREVVRPARGIQVVDLDVLGALDSDRPAEWPAQSTPIYALMSMVSIPINTSVIIAGTLDLTNQQLVIEPSVETLYIIAEEIIGAPDAAIIWRCPGGSTPAMADDPSKNGRSFSGVVTAEGSRNGLRGGDGLDGAPGVPGGRVDAPNLEIWRSGSSMPVSTNGERHGVDAGSPADAAATARESGEWWFFSVRTGKPGPWRHGGRRQRRTRRSWRRRARGGKSQCTRRHAATTVTDAPSRSATRAGSVAAAMGSGGLGGRADARQ